MINLLHITKGWARHLGILPISKELETLAEKRFEVVKLARMLNRINC